MAPLQHPWVAHLCFIPISGNKALLHAPKTPILGPTGTLSPKVKKQVFPEYPPGESSTHMVPLQYPWCLTPVLGPVLRLHLGHTLAQQKSERPHPQTLVPTVSLKERVFPGYPHTPKHLFWVPQGHFRPRSS